MDYYHQNEKQLHQPPKLPCAIPHDHTLSLHMAPGNHQAVSRNYSFSFRKYHISGVLEYATPAG